MKILGHECGRYPRKFWKRIFQCLMPIQGIGVMKQFFQGGQYSYWTWKSQNVWAASRGIFRDNVLGGTGSSTRLLYTYKGKLILSKSKTIPLTSYVPYWHYLVRCHLGTSRPLTSSVPYWHYLVRCHSGTNWPLVLYVP